MVRRTPRRPRRLPDHGGRAPAGPDVRLACSRVSSLTDRRDPWLGIELRHLAALSAIASEGTFSDAALSLGYVQSAISGQVATLERLTGTCLVERSRAPGPQRLTAA